MSDYRNGKRSESDSEFENRIRPQELEQFSGQDKTVDNLKEVINNLLIKGFRTFLVGMAMGFDLKCAKVLLEKKNTEYLGHLDLTCKFFRDER